ncbi:MAG TPA: GspH/FimT family pseudopilin [Gallionella sp.]|nr:GspH/FimT family pseudopilin [Gallionella sp.]
MKPENIFSRDATLAIHTTRPVESVMSILYWGANRKSNFMPVVLRQRLSGFSMIELLITIIVVGILAMIAVPSFSDFIAGQRIKNASFDITSALTLARSEAIKRNANVTITQAAGGWQNGWTVTAGGTTVSSRDPLSGVTIDGAAPASVTYAANGRLLAGTGTLSFEISSPNSSVSPRCISVDPSGRPNNKVGGC